MPDFMLTDPSGSRYKLTTPEGVSQDEVTAHLAQTMTHEAEKPNPAQPYLDAATRFGTGVSDTLMAGPRLMGDVMEGRLDPNSPEAIGRSTDAALSVTGMGMFGAEEGALGALGGESLVALRKLLAEGKTQRQAADELGTSVGMVQRTIRAEGLPTDPARGAPIKQVGEFTPPDPEPTIDKLVKSLFEPKKTDPYLDRLRQFGGLGRGKDTDALQAGNAALRQPKSSDLQKEPSE